jgi:hypothetical protein
MKCYAERCGVARFQTPSHARASFQSRMTVCEKSSSSSAVSSTLKPAKNLSSITWTSIPLPNRVPHAADAECGDDLLAERSAFVATACGSDDACVVRLTRC